MTISSTPSEVRYATDGVTTSFPIPFVFDTTADLKVLLTDEDGNISELTTGFTTTGGNGSTGTLVFAAAPAANQTVTILDDPEIKQATDYVSNDAFPAESHEKALDYLTRLVKRLSQQNLRALRTRDGDPLSGDDLILPSVQNRASRLMAFDADGKPEPAAAVDVPIEALTRSLIGALLYPQTPAESAAGVTPSDYSHRPLQTTQQETGRYASMADALEVLSTGLVTEPIYYLEDWGAPCNGVDDDAPALQALIDALYAIDIHETSAGRRAMPTIQLPARALRFKTNVDVGKALGTMGLTIRGCGAWATTIYVDAGVTITGKGASNLSWEHLAFRSDAIDDDVILFKISTVDGGVLRRWTFYHVDFFGIYECFNVTGDALCDEFKFIGCHFLECYRLVNNNNNQAMNWNFWACDYESTLEDNTSKDLDDACMFLLNKGMAVNWYGGSIIINGQMVLMNTSTINSSNVNAHFVNFDGVKMELMDNADNPGTHALLVKRSSNYVNGNSLKFTLQNFAMIHRGTLPSTMDLFELCNNWLLTFRNGEIEGGYVIGIIDENTSTQNGVLIVDNVLGLLYREDTTHRLLSHHQHNVTLIPPNLSDTKIVPRVQRSGGTSGVSFTQPQRLYVTGNTGSLPAGGTTVNLPDFYNHARLCELVLQQYETTSQDLTVQLRDQADTTTYASVTLLAGAGPREVRAPIAREIGFQIGTESVPVPLMLKFIGTPEIQKGVVWIEYM